MVVGVVVPVSSLLRLGVGVVTRRRSCRPATFNCCLCRRYYSNDALPSTSPVLDVVRRYLRRPEGEMSRRILLDRLASESAAVGALREEASQLTKLKQESKEEEMRVLVEEELSRVEVDLESVVASLLEEEATGVGGGDEGSAAVSSNEVMLEVSAGVGGQEAMLFAQELHEMYLAWFDFNGWESNTLNHDASDLGGLRHSSVEVRGGSVFSRLWTEAGVHRVQRVPRTEKAGRVHTSTATVCVIPLGRESDIEIKDSDIRMDTKRASGAGGQHVNTTESAVRLTHIPSGLVVDCQSQRSQIQNRSEALRVLRRRLAALEEEKLHSEKRKAKQGQVGSSNRNEKIRTYNYNQDRVTDHRVGVTCYDLRGVLQGGEALEKFTNSVREGLVARRVEEVMNSWSIKSGS